MWTITNRKLVIYMDLSVSSHRLPDPIQWRVHLSSMEPFWIQTRRHSHLYFKAQLHRYEFYRTVFHKSYGLDSLFQQGPKLQEEKEILFLSKFFLKKFF